MTGRPGGVQTYPSLIPLYQAILRAIPRAPSIIEVPVPAPPEPTMTIYPPDDLTLDAIVWLRREFPALAGHEVEDRDLAVWICGAQGYVGLWQSPIHPNPDVRRRHADILHRLYERIDRVAHPPS